jgi:hypothetical protein
MTGIALGVAAVLFALSPAHAFDVTACGQTVPDRETGILVADLDCSVDPADAAVTLGNHSVLDMNGHGIVARFIGVSCGFGESRGCVVRGHGVLPSGVGEVSGGSYGIAGAANRVTISDVYVHDVGIGGIVANNRLVLTNVTVLRSEANGIISNKGIKATNVVASDNEYVGMDAPSVKATTVTASGNGYSGVSCQRCNLTGLVANDNGVTDIPVGAGGGVQGVGARLVDSTLTANVVDGVPVDVDTFVRPRLVNTSCEHSRQRDVPSSSWGVCTAD